MKNFYFFMVMKKPQVLTTIQVTVSSIVGQNKLEINKFTEDNFNCWKKNKF